MPAVDGYQSVYDCSPNAPLFGANPDAPLFGASEHSPRERLINLVVGFVTAFIVFFTMISAFIFDKDSNRALNVTFAFVIVMICGSHLLLIYWYRQGDVDPKFKRLIYFNAFCISALCICANIYFHGG